MNVSVVGLGKIGLPLALQIASKNISVIGIDTNESTVDAINSAIEPFPNEPGMKDLLESSILRQTFRATSDYISSIGNSDVVVIVVPLIVDNLKSPEFSNIDFATALVGKNLRPGTLVIFETTVPIGTTSKRFKDILEIESGLRASEDFFIAYSPERVSSGSVFSDLKSYPKIVGGVCDVSAQKAKDFYAKILDFDDRLLSDKFNGVWVLPSAEAAEFVKLAETVYRDVNIGLVNEFADLAEELNIDIYEVIAAANSQPYSHLHTPGISVGGHCIPVYPHFYLYKVPDSQIIRAAREKNNVMPLKCKKLILEVFGSDKLNMRVLILGAVYRSNVRELAFSGVYEIYKSLKGLTSEIQVHDSLVSHHDIEKTGMSPFNGEWSSVDVIILHTSSDEYASLDFEVLTNLKLVIDGRNFFSRREIPENIKLFKYGVGWC
jgi:UDP-N-acetyl-D-glucosamine dehydrogenase